MKLKDWLSRERGKPWPMWETTYLQTALIDSRSPALEDPGGVCFRLAFKWLACKRSGQEFSYVKFRHQHGTKKKADQAITKQQVYLDKTLPHERPQGRAPAPTTKPEYKGFHANVDRESVNLLNIWGSKPNKTGSGEKYGLRFQSTEYASLAGCSALQRDISAVVGLYGKSTTGPWAHATAFHRNGGDIFYFDSNGGEFTLDPGDPAGDLLQSDLQRYAEPGDSAGYTIEHFQLYTVT